MNYLRVVVYGFMAIGLHNLFHERLELILLWFLFIDFFGREDER